MRTIRLDFPDSWLRCGRCSKTMLLIVGGVNEEPHDLHYCPGCDVPPETCWPTPTTKGNTMSDAMAELTKAAAAAAAGQLAAQPGPTIVGDVPPLPDASEIRRRLGVRPLPEVELLAAIRDLTAAVVELTAAVHALAGEPR